MNKKTRPLPLWRKLRNAYQLRREFVEPDLRRWEIVVQILCSAYLSWRWLGKSATFRPWSRTYWAWLIQYSQLEELRVRADLASKRNYERRQGYTRAERNERDEKELREREERTRNADEMARLKRRMRN